MTTSPYFDNSAMVRYNVQRAGLGAVGVTPYNRQRDYPRASRYSAGLGYNARSPDYPYDTYDMSLAERRELEDIQLSELHHNAYMQSPTGRTAIITGPNTIHGRKTTYLQSGRSPIINRFPSTVGGYTPGVRTVNVARSGPIIHRTGSRYTDQPIIDYPYDDLADEHDGYPVRAVRMPASSGRMRAYPTMYDRRGYMGVCGYENECREQIVRVPASRTLGTRHYR